MNAMQKNDVFQWKMCYLAADFIVRHLMRGRCTLIIISACRKERAKKTHLLTRGHSQQWRKNDLPVLNEMR